MLFCAVLTCAVLIIGCQGKKSGPSAVAQKDGAVVEELDVIEVVPAQTSDKATKNDKKEGEAKPETDSKDAAKEAAGLKPAETPAANEAMPTDNAPAADSESQSAYIWEEDSAVESESTFGHRRWKSSYYNCCTENSCCVPAFNPACGPCETYVPACAPACGPCAPACNPCGPACGPCVPKWGCGRRAWRSYCNPCVTYCNPCAPVCAPCGVSGCDSFGCEGTGCDGGSMDSEAAPVETPAPVSSEKSSDKADQSGKIQRLPAPTMSDYRPAGSSQAVGSEVAVPEETPTPAPVPAPTPAPEPKPESK